MKQTRQYDAEYKEQAVKLAQRIGTKKAATELGIPTGTLGGWVHKAKKGEIELNGERTPMSAMTLTEEIKQLREANKKLAKENARLKESAETQNALVSSKGTSAFAACNIMILPFRRETRNGCPQEWAEVKVLCAGCVTTRGLL